MSRASFNGNVEVHTWYNYNDNEGAVSRKTGDIKVGLRTGNNDGSKVGVNGNRLAKLPAAAGMTADVFSSTGATIKVATKITEKALKHALTRPTTLLGAGLAGIPAAINMYQNGINREDLITLGISVVAVALEFSPEGAVVNAASVIVSVGSVVWDGYQMAQ